MTKRTGLLFEYSRIVESQRRRCRAKQTHRCVPKAVYRASRSSRTNQRGPALSNAILISALLCCPLLLSTALHGRRNLPWKVGQGTILSVACYCITCIATFPLQLQRPCNSSCLVSTCFHHHFDMPSWLPIYHGQKTKKWNGPPDFLG